MVDFCIISTRRTSNGVLEIYPKFKISKSSDLMIRGGDFYAIWVEEKGFWSTDESDAIYLIDTALDEYVKKNAGKIDQNARILYMWDSDTGSIDRWHKYCQKQLRDDYKSLDENLLFSNTEVTKSSYATKRLPYPLEPCPIPSYERIISTLYSEDEREKIEWAIGAIVTGDSKKIQKFMVFYGAAGTGKSTILNIIQALFEGYWAAFKSKDLGSASSSFALESFRNNPLIAIEHDGDLSRIEDNTRLNSLVSHEQMIVNEKFKATYTSEFKSFLLLGTNRPVKITDSKSGLIRRLIDVVPNGNKLNKKEYLELMDKIKFELGGIACHCRDVYSNNPGRYDSYIPTRMLGASNDFYNFVLSLYGIYKKENKTTLKQSWEAYQVYCSDSNVAYPVGLRVFKEELKDYFKGFTEILEDDNGDIIKNLYTEFRTDRFVGDMVKDKPKEKSIPQLEFKEQTSIFDKECSEYLAQYASTSGTPNKKWDSVTTKLSSIDTSELHYVKLPENHIVIDFDLKDDSGKKSLAKNIEAASKWPKTYAELSKSGCGIHLHYIYSGDPTTLSRIYDDDIEIKVFSGKSSLRRKLTMCTTSAISVISSGLPLKEDKKVLNQEVLRTEKGLRTTIEKCLRKEVHSGTKPNVEFIHKILEEHYALTDFNYDVTDMYNDVFAFAANSSNHASYCMKMIKNSHFKSDNVTESVNDNEGEIVFFDCEVFPNLLLINWKVAGKGKQIVRMINPSPTDIEGLLKYRLIGFNCRRYDNHILYARLLGKTLEEIYEISSNIVNSPKGEGNKYLFSEAYNLSYTDVYDFAAKKQSLKKWEIELGIHHEELNLPWDQPVDEKLWPTVAKYCDNDVIATEAVFDHLSGDWIGRQILAKMAGMSPNSTTNSLTTRIIFGKERNPRLVYTDLATGEQC